MTLSELGEKYGTDKSTTHSYLDIYEKLFEPLKNGPIQILEVGVANGCSLRMWLEYFPQAEVLGMDNNPSAIRDLVEQTPEAMSGRFRTLICEQDNDTALAEWCRNDEFDIIIDDAGHDPKKQMLSFMLLWRAVKPGGYYIVEDIINDSWADYWTTIPGAVVYKNHKAGREDDILVIIQRPL
jgi:SAM-dependent methyltransferase